MDKSQWIVVGISAAGFVLGIIFMVMGILSRRKLNLIKDTPTVSAGQASQMAAPQGANKVEVHAVADSPTPLTSPATGTPCLYYKHQVEHLERRMVRDNSGYTRHQDRWETVHSNEMSVPFVLRDETGEIRVNPERASFVAKVSMKSQYGSHGYDPPHRSGAGGVVSKVLDSLDGNYDTGQYRTSEWVVPLGQPVYVLGASYSSPAGAEIRKGEGPFIISYKSEEELTKRYAWHSVLWLIFGVLFGAGGIAGAIYGATYMKK